MLVGSTRTCGHGARVDQKELRGGGWPGGHACGESVIEVAPVLEHANVEGVWSENCEVMVGSKGIVAECGWVQQFKAQELDTLNSRSVVCKSLVWVPQ